MPILSAQNITLRFGGPPLLDNVSFDIEAGDRICLVGRNGEGKSTLLKILTGEMDYNSGDIVKKSGLKVSRMVQEIPAHMEGTVRDVVMGGASLAGAHHASGDAVRNSHAEAILGKTGIDADAQFDSLSGGQKRRVLFARAVASDPDLLLLDEPTNDLDVATLRSLEEGLQEFGGCVMVVSHDRWFLDRIATHILAFEGGGKTTWFEGGFSDYHEMVAKRRGK